jgi:hypothetical protein
MQIDCGDALSAADALDIELKAVADIEHIGGQRRKGIGALD